MGVDYDGVGGIGIELTSELRGTLIDHGCFTQNEWDDDYYSCIESLKIDFAIAGDGSYTGNEDRIYLLVHGVYLEDIIANEGQFRNKLSKIGINIERKDLKVISDLRVC